MKTFPRCSSRVGLVVGLWAFSGCGGDSGGPITPKSLVVTGGNQQVGCFVDTLADSLEVTLTGNDNKPFVGAPVAWQVTQGAATLARAVDTTDAAGKSRVQLFLGFALTDVAVTATVTGLPPATFFAAGKFAPYALGQTAAGALAPGDCLSPDNTFFDVYALTIPGSQQSFTVSLVPDTFALALGDATPALVAYTKALHQRSLKVIAAGGVYLAVVQSIYAPGETGPYTLASAATPLAVDSCHFDVWVTRGIATDQEIKTTDCVDGSGPFYYDVYWIRLAAGQTMTVTESSTAFDAELLLCTDTCVSDDNSGGGTNARLTWQARPDQDEEIFIVPATAGIGETGAYTLTIAPPTAATATAASISPWGPIPSTGARGVRRSTENLLRSWHRVGGSYE